MDRRFTIAQLLAVMTAVSMVLGLIRAASVAGPAVSGLFAVLAIWIGLSVVALWGIGAWPWNRPIGR